MDLLEGCATKVDIGLACRSQHAQRVHLALRSRGCGRDGIRSAVLALGATQVLVGLGHFEDRVASGLILTQHPPRFSFDPPALRSQAALGKDVTKTGVDGEPIHNFATLLSHLSTLTRNTVVFAEGVKIEKLAVPTPTQKRAFELIGAPIPVTLGGKSTERMH